MQATVKPNKLLSGMTVCRHGLHNGVVIYILQFRENTIHRIFGGVDRITESNVLCLNLKSDDRFLSYMASQSLVIHVCTRC